MVELDLLSLAYFGLSTKHRDHRQIAQALLVGFAVPREIHQMLRHLDPEIVLDLLVL